MAWPAVKRFFTQEEFRLYLQHEVKWGAWRPTLIVLHNTAAPTGQQWRDSAAKDDKNGVKPRGLSRINSLEDYFKNQQHWSGAPHLFITDEGIWVLNPLTAPGVHSPSWNSISIGIEMVADFDAEDDDSGFGLLTRNHAIFASALLCETFGLDPNAAIKLHKEDKKTTHACPGEDFARDKAAVVASIAALMSGGEHDPQAVQKASGDVEVKKPEERKGRVISNDNLNLRAGPSVSSERLGSLPPNTVVAIVDSAGNGTTDWLRVKSPAGYTGWVAGRYIQI